MTTFPGSPKVMKGAIVGIDPFNPQASVIIFQYNPDMLTRSLTARTPERSGGEQQADSTATTMGVYPALASLEMLLYPKSLSIIANEVLLRLGVVEVVAPEAPLTLFVWGPKRVLPVRLTSFSINEQAFDPGLNPIRASASLSLTVLNYHDLGLASVGGALFMAHQVTKEVMATINGRGNIASSASAPPLSIGIGV